MLVRISSLFATLSELACRDPETKRQLVLSLRPGKSNGLPRPEARMKTSVTCEVTYSTYSLSLAGFTSLISLPISEALATAVGGWDPDHLAEASLGSQRGVRRQDWHMFAKCFLKSEGRVRPSLHCLFLFTRDRCVPIFLPVLNYTPEEDGPGSAAGAC